MSLDAWAASGCTVTMAVVVPDHGTGARHLAAHNSRVNADWVLGIFCGGAYATKSQQALSCFLSGRGLGTMLGAVAC